MVSIHAALVKSQNFNFKNQPTKHMSSSSIGSSSSGASSAPLLPPPETGAPETGVAGGQPQTSGGSTDSGAPMKMPTGTGASSTAALENGYVATGESQGKKEGKTAESEEAIPSNLQGMTGNQSLKDAKLQSTGIAVGNQITTGETVSKASTGIITGKNVTLDQTIPKAASSFLNPPGYFDAPAEKPLSTEGMMEGFENVANVLSNPTIVVAGALLAGLGVTAGAGALIEALTTGGSGGSSEETSTSSSSSSTTTANGVTTTSSSTTDASGSTTTTVSTSGQPEEDTATTSTSDTGGSTGYVGDSLTWDSLYAMIGELFNTQMELQATAFEVSIEQTNLSIQTSLDKADKMESMAMTGLIVGITGASIGLAGAAVSGYGAYKAGTASASVAAAQKPTFTATGALNKATSSSQTAAASAGKVETANAKVNELQTRNAPQAQIENAQAEAATAQNKAATDLDTANADVTAAEAALKDGVNDEVKKQGTKTLDILKTENAHLGTAIDEGNPGIAKEAGKNIDATKTDMDGTSQKFEAAAMQTKYQAGSQESQWSMAIGQAIKTVGEFVSGSLNQFFEKMNQADITVLEAEGQSTKAAADCMTQTINDTNTQLKAIRDTMASIRSAQTGTIPKIA